MKLSYEHENQLKNLFFSISNSHNKIHSFSDDKKEYIKKQSLISNIGASTRIENAILTDTEIKMIDTLIETEGQDFDRYIKNKLSKDKERSLQEVIGYRAVLQFIYTDYASLVPLTESDLKGLHRELMKPYKKATYFMGNYKRNTNNVIETNLYTGNRTTVFESASPGPITETAMYELVKWASLAFQKSIWIIPEAVEFIFRFLAIHPFQDGNGRMSRLLFQLFLLNAKDNVLSNIIPFIAFDREIEKQRATYYSVLRKCSGGIFHQDSRDYDFMPFLIFMVDCLEKSLLNVDYYSQKYDHYQMLPESAKKVLSIFKDHPEKKLNTAFIEKNSDIPRRTIITSYKPLIQGGFLQEMGTGPQKGYRIVF